MKNWTYLRFLGRISFFLVELLWECSGWYSGVGYEPRPWGFVWRGLDVAVCAEMFLYE